ncbi:hypothetical protein Ahu01nite_059400 [Winogradskya humida]|uniref:Nucleoside phosphorylase n=1 Tax=Winogradskya humida TaxID=113566 RepID=A0ABQ3ZWJ8_9ACTN|nr:hypothetical protein Ahu01nite_059400 [Actinoplanes humidus]
MEKSRILIGLVTALSDEWDAVESTIDNPAQVTVDGDTTSYLYGTVPSRVQGQPHHVIAVQQVIDGNRSAAAVSARLAASFPGVRHLIMCGIAGGVPSAGHDIRIGDVVSSTRGIVDYDHVRSEAGGDRLRRPVEGLSKLLLSADQRLEAAERAGRATWFQALEAPFDRKPAVHRGAIGSADRLLRNAALRDRLAREFGVIAVEMEAAGLAVGADLNGLHWYVVRGISDLADGTKSDDYHKYAASTAAAYVRSLLHEVAPPSGHAEVSEDGFGAIVSALTLLLSDEQNRRTILRRLPANIRTQVPNRDTARIQAVELVGTCERFPGGGESLLDAVGAVAADDPDFPMFTEALRLHWRGR